MITSKFVNLKVRELSAETCHEFIEWCGLIDGAINNPYLRSDKKSYNIELYDDFTSEYSDYASRGKEAVSKTKFYKWLVSYCLFKEGIAPEEGRDSVGRWIRIIKLEKQQHIPF